MGQSTWEAQKRAEDAEKQRIADEAELRKKKEAAVAAKILLEETRRQEKEEKERKEREERQRREAEKQRLADEADKKNLLEEKRRKEEIKRLEEEERKRKEKEEKEEKKVKNEKNEKERVEKKRREKEEERRKKLNDVDLKRPARIKALRGTHVMVKVATTGSQKYVTIMEEEIQKSLHIAEEAKLTNQGQQKNMEGNIAMKQVEREIKSMKEEFIVVTKFVENESQKITKATTLVNQCKELSEKLENKQQTTKQQVAPPSPTPPQQQLEVLEAAVQHAKDAHNQAEDENASNAPELMLIYRNLKKELKEFKKNSAAQVTPEVSSDSSHSLEDLEAA